ncbi:MAG: PqqD family protein [Ruminococcaceae bacterium]|nr:PqqD family protein [Oscillospiraceae bacterium]
MRAARKNFLDCIPAVADSICWNERDGIVTIHMIHRGVFAAVAQQFFGRPRVSHIELDGCGSFVFRSIDGQRTVEELARLLDARFGREAEPLYGRLVRFLQILRNNRFIEYPKMKNTHWNEAGTGRKSVKKKNCTLCRGSHSKEGHRIWRNEGQSCRRGKM